MATIEHSLICTCTNCGNEAEMVVTCRLPEESTAPAQSPPAAAANKVQGTATCSHCGNEADMWIEP